MHIRQNRLIGLILLVTILIVALVTLLIRPALPAFANPPNPNGYDTLVNAAIQLGQIDDSTETNNFSEFLQTKSDVYALISNGLKQQIEAPPDGYKYSGGMKTMQDLMGFRRLERALTLKSKSFTDQNEPGKAAELLIDVIHLGQQVEHGPLICFMVGSAVEISGTRKLAGLLPRLNTNDLVRVSQRMQALTESRLPYEEIAARERYYIAMNTRNPWMRLKDLLKGESKAALNDGRERYLNTAAIVQVTVGGVAIQLFSLQEGHPPTNISELVPRYINELRDPYSGKPLLMKTETNKTVLCSVGVNGIDDSGGKDDVKLDHEDEAGTRMLIRGLSNQ
jgi:hypothetical protein